MEEIALRANSEVCDMAFTGLYLIYSFREPKYTTIHIELRGLKVSLKTLSKYGQDQNNS